MSVIFGKTILNLRPFQYTVCFKIVGVPLPGMPIHLSAFGLHVKKRLELIRHTKKEYLNDLLTNALEMKAERNLVIIQVFT